MSRNELVQKIAARAAELADLPMEELRVRLTRTINGALWSASDMRTFVRLTRGQLVEKLLNDMFLEF